MMSRKQAWFHAFTLASFLLSGLCGAATEMKLPVPERETLPNGLQLVWFLNDSLPVIDMALLVKSGSRDDPWGKSGTAELVADSLDRGNDGLTSQELARKIEVLGASRYSSCEEDTFSVGVHGLAPDAPALLDVLGKLVLKPEFPEAEIKREHARLLDRWNHLADYGESLAGLAYRRLLTSGTTYGRGSFLSIKEFDNVSRGDVLAYYKTHFTPENSILMVVGRVKKDEFKKQIEAVFGAWQGEAPKKEYRKFVEKRLLDTKGKIVVVGRANLTQAQVRIGFKSPSIHAPEHYDLTVGNALLGEYFNSRLNSLIRDKLALTYGISSSFSFNQDFASFSIGSATKNESVGPLVQKTLEVLKNFKSGPISDEEVTTAKEYLVGGFPLSVSTLGAVASRWLAGYVFDLGPTYLNEFVPKISAVTPAQVLAAAAKDFDLDHLTIVVAGEPKEIQKSLSAAGFKSIKQVSVKDLE